MIPGAPPHDLLRTLQQALSLHREGRLNEAEALYRNVLLQAPLQPDALHFWGVLEGQRGRHEQALSLMERSIAANPRQPAVHYNRANLLRDMGRLDEALAGYEAALAINPGNIAVLNNRGAVLEQLGRHEEAITAFDRVLALKPDHADALVNRGNALVALARFDEALTTYQRALALAPNNAAAHYGMGNALAKLGRNDEALAGYDKALEAAGENADILGNRGSLLARLNRFDDALDSFARAIAAAPNSAQAYNNRAVVLMRLSRFEEALADYDRALAIMPDYEESLYGRGSALIDLNRHDEAIAALQDLLRRNPDYPYALGMLVHAQKTACDWRDPAAENTMIQSIRAGKEVASPLALLAVSDSTSDKLTCSEILVRDKFTSSQPRLWRGQPYGHERIRVGYLSADFRNHPVAMLTAGVFEHHDHRRFETVAFSYGLDDASPMRARLMRSFDRFLNVRTMSDAGIAALVRENEIDILIDLTGLTASARPGVLSLRPAPVQVNYLGFAGTMGASFIDYILADPTVIPESQQIFYREKVVYLPDCYLPHDRARIIGQAPSRAQAGLPERGFVFASFNNSYKFAPATFDIWMRLLRGVEGSVLWLSQANPAAMRNLRREAEARGVDATRLIFAPRLPAPEDHLARLGLADLFLDTLPYNAHTTAMDALWAGLPVLTLIGESFAGRVAASQLYAAGLPELIAETPAAYEQKAMAMAREPGALAKLKTKLAAARLHCALFDTERFTRNLESALHTMWRRVEAGAPAASFHVAAVEPS